MKKNSGFTLVEMLLTVSVLTVVLTMAFPDFIGFFKKNKARTDQIQMTEIQNALEAYAEAQNTLPTALTWVNDLAPYTHLSPALIGTDVYGISRTYLLYTETGATFRASNNMDFDYAIIVSSGGDDSGALAKLDGTYTLGSVSDYEGFTPSGNDIYIKYTNRRLKMDAYNETVLRMERVSDALASYASFRQNEELAKVTPSPSANVWLYYPPSRGTDTLSAPARTALYSATVLSDTSTYASVNYIENRGGSTGLDSSRSTQMKGLMRLLGLPEEYCCSAIDKDTNGDPSAFYYYSNPKTPPACTTNPLVGNRHLPPRLTSSFDSCG